MSNDDKCPCVDGLPDPCTLCGAPADGVCEIDTLVGWKHRAQRAEAEARQLREAVMEAATELGLTHEPEWASPAAKEKGLNPVWCAICGSADGSWPCTSQMVLDDLLAAVAEGAEDRGQTDG